MARRYMHGKRRRRSPLLDKGVDLKLNEPTKESKIKTRIFAKGGGSESGHKVFVGGKIGYKGKYGEISLHPSIISEGSKYHSFTKPDVKIGAKISFGQLAKLFKGK